MAFVKYAKLPAVYMTVRGEKNVMSWSAFSVHGEALKKNFKKRLKIHREVVH